MYRFFIIRDMQFVALKNNSMTMKARQISQWFSSQSEPFCIHSRWAGYNVNNVTMPKRKGVLRESGGDAAA